MEKTLSRLFDFQRFGQEPALQEAIDTVHSRYAVRELSMDEMEMLSAAGAPDQTMKRKKADELR